jgi:hypothetical protein
MQLQILLGEWAVMKHRLTVFRAWGIAWPGELSEESQSMTLLVSEALNQLKNGRMLPKSRTKK